ncbi:unnamed protein product [Heterobilharzia americana]|nr:unnamed protein product [Heterobilharzia americana]
MQISQSCIAVQKTYQHRILSQPSIGIDRKVKVRSTGVSADYPSRILEDGGLDFSPTIFRKPFAGCSSSRCSQSIYAQESASWTTLNPETRTKNVGVQTDTSECSANGCRNISERLERIERMMASLMATSSLHKQVASMDSSERLNVSGKWLIDSDLRMQEFEQYMTDLVKCNSAAQELSCLVESDIGVSVRRIMGTLLEPNFGILYSWSSTQDKRPFKKTLMSKIIFSKLSCQFYHLRRRPF